MEAVKIIMNYLTGLAETDDAIKNALKNNKKNESKMMSYIFSEAKKQAKNNAACISDDEVYKWARHYWLEQIATDTDKSPEIELKIGDVKVIAKPTPKIKNTKKENGQLSLFDFDL